MQMKIVEMIEIGKKLGEKGLIDGASGNMSCRIDNFMLITKSGSILDRLTPKDVALTRIGEFREGISSDWKVHSEIYRVTDYKAVIHCHGVYNVTLSMKTDTIRPVDLEGGLFLKEVNVVEGDFGSYEVAKRIAREIEERGIVVHRGHGIYSAGMTLIEAFNKACYLEHSCEILYRLSDK